MLDKPCFKLFSESDLSFAPCRCYFAYITVQKKITKNFFPSLFGVFSLDIQEQLGKSSGSAE